MLVTKSSVTAVLLAGTMALMMPSTAHAGVVLRRDPEDVSGRLDMVRVSARVRGERMVLTIRTAEAWRCRYLKSPVESYDSRGGTFRWSVDTDTDPYVEHTASYRCQNGKVFLDFARAGKSFRATRPNRKSVRVSLPRDRFGLEKKKLELQPASRVDGKHGTNVLFDHEDYTRRLRPNA